MSIQKAKLRAEVAEADKWRLEDLFATTEAWEAELTALKDDLARIGAYKGELKKGVSVVKACLTLDQALGQRLEMLYVYAHCRRDENSVEPVAVARYQRVYALYVEYGEVTSFVVPELSALPLAKLQAYAANKALVDFDYMLKGLIRQKAHILSEAEESILAQMRSFSGKFGEIFSVIDNAELHLPKVEADGESIQLTHGTYSQLLQNPKQAVRKTGFDALYETFKGLNNTIATIYGAEVLSNVFSARVRKYDDALTAALEGEDVPRAVYDKLLSAIHTALPVMHDYVRTRRDILKIEQHMYDMYMPLVEGAEMKLPYKKACQVVLEGLAPLGEKYAKLLKAAFKNGWIDVYETENKRSGAYCTHAYKAPHPYVLLNYSATTHDIFTIAHELGHAMHSHFSAKSQPASKADYRIFVAEVASTVNESLLLAHLLRTTTDKALKKFLLAYKLDTIRTTIFRQTMFSEFEARAHALAEEGQPLTAETLNALYWELNKQYYGDGVVHDDYIQYEWSRIPHFYTAFYVYKYATGLTAALHIADRILSGDQGVTAQYFNFLKAGGHKSPYEILKDAGADMATDAPYENLAGIMKKTLQELKDLA
ncbi:MAG: oligoendopeptidase F [Clostridiales bacterium]|jgi:oligoendopeptidase F|nr:oligoendopeptidase F [Clostridiales bacterium]